MEPAPRTARVAPVSHRPRVDHRSAANFRVGEALSRSFGIFGKQLLVLLSLAALFQAVPTLVSYLRYQALVRMLEETAFRSLAGSMFGWAVLDLVAEYVFPLAFQAIVAYAVFQSLRGHPAGWGRSVGNGLKRLPNALGASLLAVLVIAVPAILVMAFLAFLAGQVGALIGAALAYVWGFAMLCAWYVCVQCAVVEGGTARAVARSSFLTRGARGKILAILLVMYLVPGVVSYAVSALAFPASGFRSHWQTQVFTLAALSVVFTAVQAVTAAVVYHDLRKVKEGVDVADLVKVFE